ncbi:MAG: chemotaxis protein CheW [Halobacteriota archaeon]|nr:chemotaxis protein CheW [Halobacteriota archaeon]
MMSQTLHGDNIHEGTYMAFSLMDEVYGVEVSKIEEIVTVPELTPLDDAPDLLEGVLDICGEIIPVIDLRKRFGLPVKGTSDEITIIVVRSDDILVGMLVDSVTDSMVLGVHSIEDLPSLASEVTADLIGGVSRLSDGTLLIIVDLVRVLSKGELETISDRVKGITSA